MKSFSPETNCNQKISKEEAFEDQIKSAENRIGLMYCYCKRIMYDEIYGGQKIGVYKLMSETFANGEKYCETWIGQYLKNTGLLLSVPLIIVFINWVSKTILRLMTKYERR